jgi:hypothetical protein
MFSFTFAQIYLILMTDHPHGHVLHFAFLSQMYSMKHTRAKWLESKLMAMWIAMHMNIIYVHELGWLFRNARSQSLDFQAPPRLRWWSRLLTGIRKPFAARLPVCH